jgi:hypothetical protein
MPTHYYKRQAECIERFVNEDARQSAAITHFVQRDSPLDGPTFAQTMILGLLETPDASLNQLAHVASRLGVAITRQALDERLTPSAVMFLADLFRLSLTRFHQHQRLPLAVLQAFQAVHVLDSTQVALPIAFQSIFPGSRSEYPSLKVHLSLDYLTGDLNAIQWVAGRSPDQNCRLLLDMAQPASLNLFDLGYFAQDTLAELQQQSAFFVCRLQSQTAIFDPNTGQRLWLHEIVKQQPFDQAEYQWQIGGRQQLAVRGILRRVPPAVADERRRKAKHKAHQQHKTCSQAYLTILEWDVFITNVPSDWLSAAHIPLVYDIRWQVELYFKAWKSQLQLNQIGNWRVERVLCYLYARFIAVVLTHTFLAPYWVMGQAELSLTKAIQVLQKRVGDLLGALRTSQAALMAYFSQWEADLRRYACKDRRRKSPSTYSRLLALNECLA